MGSLRTLKMEGSLSKDEMRDILYYLAGSCWELYACRGTVGDQSDIQRNAEEEIERLKKGYAVLERRTLKRKFKRAKAVESLDDLAWVMSDLAHHNLTRQHLDAALDESETLIHRLMKMVDRA
jgi:hypothetical protein